MGCVACRFAVAIVLVATFANTIATFVVPHGVPGGSWWTGEIASILVLGGAAGLARVVTWALDGK